MTTTLDERLGETVEEACLSCCSKESKGPAVKHSSHNIQILIIGDEGAGKTVLAQNLVDDHATFRLDPMEHRVKAAFHKDAACPRKQEQTTRCTVRHAAPAFDLCERVSKVVTRSPLPIQISSVDHFLENPFRECETAEIHLNIVNVSGGQSNRDRQMREAYYTTSQIVFLLYNVAQPMTLFNAINRWPDEINDATKSMQMHDLDNVKMVLLGVNRDARLRLPVVERLPSADIDQKQLSKWKNATKNMSVKKPKSTIHFGRSRKRAAIREVGNEREDISRFIWEVISHYVFKQEIWQKLDSRITQPSWLSHVDESIVEFPC